MTDAPMIEDWQERDAYLSWLACIEEMRQRPRVRSVRSATTVGEIGMKSETVTEARDLAKHFIHAVAQWQARVAEEGDDAGILAITGCRESGAMRRASMELTRAPARMRGP